MKTKLILTILTFTKILLEKSHFTFVTRLQRNDRGELFLFLVCGRFNIFFLASSFASIYQPQSEHIINCINSIFASYKNIL